MTKVTPNSIRTKVMKERGITTFKPEHGKHKRLRPAFQVCVEHELLKTPMMRYLELVHGEPIEQILLSGSLSVVAKKLDNEVDTSTLSKWIKRLRLRYTGDNLPRCEDCPKYGSACDSGVCYILVELELYDLLQIKRKEVMENGSIG